MRFSSRELVGLGFYTRPTYAEVDEFARRYFTGECYKWRQRAPRMYRDRQIRIYVDPSSSSFVEM